MTDAETTAAVAALAHRIRERDAAIRDGGDYADPDVFAREYITGLRGFGWRPTAAKVHPVPVHAPPEPRSGSREEMLAAARARCEEATAAQAGAIRQRQDAEGVA